MIKGKMENMEGWDYKCHHLWAFLGSGKQFSLSSWIKVAFMSLLRLKKLNIPVKMAKSSNTYWHWTLIEIRLVIIHLSCLHCTWTILRLLIKMIPIYYGNKLEMSIDPGNSQNILVTYGNNSIWLDEVNL